MRNGDRVEGGTHGREDERDPDLGLAGDHDGCVDRRVGARPAVVHAGPARGTRRGRRTAGLYLLNLGAASELGIDEEQVRGVLAAVAPIVGTTRVVSATGNIARALGFAIELADMEDE